MALDVTEKTEEAFKENFDAKLAAAKSVGTNAVFVHVRPFADSLYPSEYESWSHLLTDMQGKDPGYDPMEYMVNAAHEQNMQFHAWSTRCALRARQSRRSLTKMDFICKIM